MLWTDWRLRWGPCTLRLLVLSLAALLCTHFSAEPMRQPFSPPGIVAKVPPKEPGVEGHKRRAGEAPSRRQVIYVRRRDPLQIWIILGLVFMVPLGRPLTPGSELRPLSGDTRKWTWKKIIQIQRQDNYVCDAEKIYNVLNATIAGRWYINLESQRYFVFINSTQTTLILSKPEGINITCCWVDALCFKDWNNGKRTVIIKKNSGVTLTKGP